MLLRLLKKSLHLDGTIQILLYSGIAWGLLGFSLSLLAELMLFLPPIYPGVLDYGHLKPVSSFVLLYGGFLSFALGLSYYILQKTLLAPQAKGGAPASVVGILAFICMKLQGVAILIGIFAILGGYNQGREWGEMPWLADNLLLLPLLSVPLLIIAIGLWQKKNTALQNPVLLLLFIAFAGGLVSFTLGNFSIPVSLLRSASFATGIQDAFLQELYRTGLLFFMILALSLSVLYYFIPLYYKSELYSLSIAYFVSISLLCLVVPATGAYLVHSTLPAWMQTLGISCFIALNFGMLGGALNAKYSITRSSKKFHTDSIAFIWRSALFFLIINTILRAVLTPRSMQAWAGYTSLDISDLSWDLKCYALPLMLATGLVVLQSLHNTTFSRSVIRWFAGLSFMAVLCFYLSNFIMGFSEYSNVSAWGLDGKELAVVKWSDIFLSASLYQPSGNSINTLAKYLLSPRSIGLLAHFLFVAAWFSIAFYVLLRAVRCKEATGYEWPNLEVKEKV